ncbi:hypothetical protein Tco_1241751, partial [Tanacetum coccineum]
APLSTWYPLLPSKLSLSSSDLSPSSSRSSSSSPSSPSSSPSSSSSATSSGTPHSPSRPLRSRRHQLLSYSIPSPSVYVGPSRKRCRSPTSSLLAAIPAPSSLTSVPADRLPPRKRLRSSPAASLEENTIEATSEASIEDTIKAIIEAIAEAVILPVLLELTIVERLDDQSEMIGQMYEHLLEIPLLRIDEINEEIRAMRVRVVATEQQCASVQARARVAEQRDVFSRDRIS